MILDEEITEKINKQNPKIGGYVKVLYKFSVVGFLEANDMIVTMRLLDKENITYGHNKSKYLVWIDTLSPVLQKSFTK